MKLSSNVKGNYLIICVIGICLSVSVEAADLSGLSKGFTRAENITPFRTIKTEFGYRPTYLVNIGIPDTYYGLSRDGGGVAYYDLANKTTPEGWPLTRWPHQTIAPEQQKAYDTFHMDFPYDTYRIIKLPVNTYGCLSLTPLRYGDIEGDGKNELVLFLGKDMVVFSPEYQRIVFAQTLDAGDWVDAEDTAGAYSRSREGIGQYAVQFLSSLAYSNDAVDIYGVRVYSKIYLGDFDKDNNPDILVWTKAYRSKLKSDPVPGFDAVRQNWYHFERDLTAQADSPAGVTGEYLPQTTDEATIKTWLTDNALTWKKGYPDVSECAADAGKPIPEMSDPLLNDPEVLQ